MRTTHEAQVSLKRILRVDETLHQSHNTSSDLHMVQRRAQRIGTYVLSLVSRAPTHPFAQPVSQLATNWTLFLWGSINKNNPTRPSSLLIPMLCKACLLLISFACLAKPDASPRPMGPTRPLIITPAFLTARSRNLQWMISPAASYRTCAPGPRGVF